MNTSDLASKVLIVGVPVAVAMCGWGLTEIISNGKRLERALTAIEAQQRQLTTQDGRINRLENGYFGAHP
jgi:hypothetical protein